MRQGPHHSAQKSTRTKLLLSMVSLKFSRVSSTVATIFLQSVAREQSGPGELARSITDSLRTSSGGFGEVGGSPLALCLSGSGGRNRLGTNGGEPVAQTIGGQPEPAAVDDHVGENLLYIGAGLGERE